MTSNKSKRYTKEERLSILNFVKDHSIKDTMEQFNVSNSTIYKWLRDCKQWVADDSFVKTATKVAKVVKMVDKFSTSNMLELQKENTKLKDLVMRLLLDPNYHLPI